MVHSRLHDCFFIDVCKLIGRNKRDRIDVVHDKVDKVDFHLRLDIDDWEMFTIIDFGFDHDSDQVDCTIFVSIDRKIVDYPDV